MRNLYLEYECEQQLSLRNVLQNDPIAIQQHSKVLLIINDAALAPTAESAVTFHTLYMVHLFSDALCLKIMWIVILTFPTFETYFEF